MSFRKFLEVNELSPIGEQIASAKGRAWIGIIAGGVSGLVSLEATSDHRAMIGLAVISIGGLALGAREALTALDMEQKASDSTLDLSDGEVLQSMDVSRQGRVPVLLRSEAAVLQSADLSQTIDLSKNFNR